MRGPVHGRPAVEGVLGGQVSARRVRQQRAERDQVPVAAGAVQREAERQQLLAGEACLHARARARSRRHDGGSAGRRATRAGARDVAGEGRLLEPAAAPSTKDRRAAAALPPAAERGEH